MLTISNPKTAKGESLGYLTGILHLAPHDVAVPGKSVCPYATLGCIASCLNTAGRGGIFKAGETTNAIQEARARKTRAFFADRDAFLADLVKAIEFLIRKALREGLRPAVRLNGTSDLSWERFPVKRKGRVYRNIMLAFPDVQFYDYTKSEERALTAPRLAPNYALTFSRSEETTDGAVRAMVAQGVNVAVPFAAKVLPAEFAGVRVINGDESDLRFLDPQGVIVGLTMKGRARKDQSGFVVR